jgi:protein TonB
MKLNCLLFASLLFSSICTTSFAQSKPDEITQNEEVLITVDTPPMFIGGMPILKKYLSDNLSYPRKAAKKNIEGTVYISFVVDTDGKVTEVTILKGIGYGCDQEAERVVKRMPSWIPGQHEGKKVKVRYSLPISFKLR